ncbi:hypothetical protein BS78_K324100 [Paspalum vaginatum]|uniref:PB1 domain-containing protein n=1 Tax=Paspalum vaginatum TaxID=158149 RepID=A0A9W8CGC5_9POAL|nr:hypothetical protein BS78_K324100 [Paspalum vaginatum]
MAGLATRPPWLLDGMDSLSSYNLEIRIIANNTRFKSWYRHSQVVDADVTNFKDLVDDILNTFPCGYGDVVKLLYYCHVTKSNIEISSDQELLEMFAKHKSTKTCYLSLLYYHPSSEPSSIPLWEEVDLPCTPSASTPPQVQSTLTETKTQAQPKDLYLMNPEP